MFGDLKHFGDLLTRNARKYPRDIGAVYKEKRIPWKEINDRSNQLANALSYLSVKRDERVGILSKNRSEWIEIIFGIIKLGAIVIPLNYRMSPDELNSIFKNIQIKTVIAENEFKNFINDKNVLNVILIDGEDSGAMNFEKLIGRFSTYEPKELQLGEDDICFIMHTSGMTGHPKGVMWAHKNMILHSANQSYCFNFRHEHAILNTAPFVVTGGICHLLKGVYAGAKNVVVNFDPIEVLGAIEKEKINMMNTVPTTLNILINHPDLPKYKLSSLQRVIYAASPIPLPVLTKAMKAFRCEFIQGYGLTETATGGTVLYPYEHLVEDPEKNKRLKSCGRETINTRVRVVNERGEDVGPGTEIGEIIIKSFGNMKGYWNMPELTKETLRDGYVYTGDLATIDEDMYIYIVDRKKDVIITGGLNVYSSEVESALYSHPAVLEAAVIGIPDEKWIETIKAFVKLKKGMSVTNDELIDYCKGKLSSYKKPRSVEIVDELPKTPYGKILKRELRKKYWKDKD